MAMKVVFKRNWFAPNGEFYRAEESPCEVPDEMKKFLPRDAKVVDKVPPKTIQKPEVLRDFDQIRSESDTSAAKI